MGADSPTSSRRLVRVASYNVHRCFGTDGRFDPQRVLQVIESTGAAIIGLQEVDIHELPPDDAPGILDLAAEAGFHITPGPTFSREDAHYGNALLCRNAPVEVRFHDLSVAHREPRGAIDACLAVTDSLTLRVIVTHLGLRRAERRAQAQALLETLGEPDRLPTVMLGDLNEWRARPATLHGMIGWFGPQPAPRTYPSRWPLLSLDRIWGQPSSMLQGVSVLRNGPASVASDHLPIVADLELPTA